MYMCVDCKSHNIVETSTYEAYFREGDYVRLRRIEVFQNINNQPGFPKGYMASCPELSITITSIGETISIAISKLGELLQSVYGVQLLGNKLED